MWCGYSVCFSSGQHMMNAIMRSSNTYDSRNHRQYKDKCLETIIMSSLCPAHTPILNLFEFMPFSTLVIPPAHNQKKGFHVKSHTDQKTKPTNYHFIIFGKKLLWCHGIWWEWMPFWHCLQHFLIYIIWQRKYSGFIRRHL